MLSFRHLTIFKAVAESGSFTKAADRLYITQSAVSHAIKDLERDTGAILFDRLPKRVQLTAAGRVLLEEAAPILSACEALNQRMPHLEARAPVHIVSSITIATHWLPTALRQMQQDWADVPVQVDVLSAADAMERLRTGAADCALLEGARPKGPFTCVPFASYALLATAAPDYPLPPLPLSLDAFCAQKLLLREPGSAVRDVLDSALLLSGRTVYPAWVSVNSPALIAAAKAELGIAVLPELLVRSDLADGTLIPVPVDGLSLHNDLLAVWHREKYLTAPLKALLSRLLPTGECP